MKRFAAVQSAVQIKRCNHSFACPGKNRVLLTPPAFRFCVCHDDMRRKTCGSRRPGACIAAHKRVQAHGQPALILIRVFGIKPGGDYHSKNTIAQEFEPLVRTAANAGVR